MLPLRSSTAKGQFLKRALQLCIDDDACLAARQPVLRVLSFEYIAPGPDVHSVSEDMCVAFMVFLWGWKWEKTATWFGLLNEWPGGNAPVQGHQEAVTCYNVLLHALAREDTCVPGTEMLR